MAVNPALLKDKCGLVPCLKSVVCGTSGDGLRCLLCR